MRLVFFLLLLVNLLLLVWSQGYWTGPETGREPERLQRQIDPEKLHILHGEAASPAMAAPRCKRIEWLSAAEAAAIQKTIAVIPAWEAQMTPLQDEPAHWVAIPELASRALADKKKSELQQLGVNESEIIEDATLGPYAVSLGVFRSQALAEEYMQVLGRKGVRSARLMRRALSPERFTLELRAPGNELDQRLPELMTALPQAKLADCAGT